MSDEFPDKFRGKQGARAFFSIDEKIERHEKEKKEAEEVENMWRVTDDLRERHILQEEERQREKERRRELERQRWQPQNVEKTRAFFNIPTKEEFEEQRAFDRAVEEERQSHPWRSGYQTFKIGYTMTPSDVYNYASAEFERTLFKQEQEERKHGVQVMKDEMKKLEKDREEKRALEMANDDEEDGDNSQSLLSLAKKLARPRR